MTARDHPKYDVSAGRDQGTERVHVGRVHDGQVRSTGRGQDEGAELNQINIIPKIVPDGVNLILGPRATIGTGRDMDSRLQTRVWDVS